MGWLQRLADAANELITQIVVCAASVDGADPEPNQGTQKWSSKDYAHQKAPESTTTCASTPGQVLGLLDLDPAYSIAAMIASAISLVPTAVGSSRVGFRS